MWSSFEITNVAAAAINYYTLQCRRQKANAVIGAPKCRYFYYWRFIWWLTLREQVSWLMELHKHTDLILKFQSEMFSLILRTLYFHRDGIFPALFSFQIWERLRNALWVFSNVIFALWMQASVFAECTVKFWTQCPTKVETTSSKKKEKEVPGETCGECVCGRVYVDTPGQSVKNFYRSYF